MKKYCLKGGLVGLLIFVVYIIFSILLDWLAGGVMGFSSTIWGIISFLPMKIIQIFSSEIPIIFIGVWVIIPVLFFLVGSFIGLFYGRNKKI